MAFSPLHDFFNQQQLKREALLPAAAKKRGSFISSK